MLIQVNNSELFHINRKIGWSNNREFKVGDKITIGKSINRHFSVYQRDWKELLGLPEPPAQFMKGVHQARIRLNNDMDFLFYSHKAWYLAQQYAVYSSELILENVRLEKYKTHPSRLTCMWLIETEEELSYWLTILECPEGYQIVKAKVSGIIHIADGTFLSSDWVPYEKMLEKADYYWEGHMTEFPQKEVLFEGDIEIIGVNNEQWRSDG